MQKRELLLRDGIYFRRERGKRGRRDRGREEKGEEEEMRREKRRSSCDGNFRRQRETGRVREKRGKKGREEKRELLSRDGNYFCCERGRRGRKVLLATEILRRERETGRVKREREEKEGESAKRDERKKGRKKGGEEFNFPPFAQHTHARNREEAGQRVEESGRGGKVGKKEEREGRE